MKIGFFGCSFTEGGGLNSPDFLDFAIKNNLLPAGKYYNDDEKQNTIMETYRFSTLVGNELNCQIDNYGISRGSNEHILKNLYENYTKYDACVVQFTFYFRQYIWSINQGEFYNINGLYNIPNIPQDVIDYFEKTHTEYYNEDYEKNKISMFVELFDNLFKNKNKKVLWLFHDSIPKTLKSKNILHFGSVRGNSNLGSFVEENKLNLKHATNGKFNDGHYSVEGHQQIANKIIKRLR